MDNLVRNKVCTYPHKAQKCLEELRALIFDVANANELGTVEETLKWGEPSYTVKGGSPIRMDWKASQPEFVFMYFNCNTRLVETFRELYGEDLQLDGKRAIALRVDAPADKEILKECISMALRYHKIKHLPLLGK